MSEWKPIDTAPKDGTWVLLAGGATDEGAGIYDVVASDQSDVSRHFSRQKSEAEKRVVSAFWLPGDCGDGYWAAGFWDGAWRTSYEDPTHWMEMPVLVVNLSETP